MVHGRDMEHEYQCDTTNIKLAMGRKIGKKQPGKNNIMIDS